VRPVRMPRGTRSGRVPGQDGNGSMIVMAFHPNYVVVAFAMPSIKYDN
jgi:hypothetical protein